MSRLLINGFVNTDEEQIYDSDDMEALDSETTKNNFDADVDENFNTESLE